MPLICCAPLSSVMAPTASVLPSPLNATEKPNWSPSPGTSPLLGLTGIRRLDVRLLRPGRTGAREDVDGAGLRDGVVVLIAVDAGCGARFPVCGDRHRIAVAAQRDRRSEMTVLPGVGCLDVRLLRPRITLADVDVDGARTRKQSCRSGSR